MGSGKGADLGGLAGADAVNNPLEVGGATTPVRSFYQTNTLGLRMMIELDWKVFRSGAVQQLTSVSW